MRFLLLLGLTGLSIYGQWDADSLMIALDEPDEESFYEILLDRLFTQDRNSSEFQGDLVFRQRLGYSSTSGWSILNKSRMRHSDYLITVLAEQDPGEQNLSDHLVFCMVKKNPQNESEVLLGDFQVRWGAGYLFDQPTSRRSLSPSSLSARSTLQFRPHLSTRESGYFHGAAYTKRSRGITFAAFLSQRNQLGTGSGQQFHEDGDGRHPSSDVFEIHQERASGVAGQTEMLGVSLFMGAQQKATRGWCSEWGLQKESDVWGKLQTGGDFQGNMFVSWYFKKERILWSSRLYRHRKTDRWYHPAPFSTLTDPGNMEQGLGLRAQFRPSRRFLLRMAFDEAVHLCDASLLTLAEKQKTNIEMTLKRAGKLVRLDYGHSRERQLSPSDTWMGLTKIPDIHKMGVRFVHDIDANVHYTITGKAGFSTSCRSFLIQQVIAWRQGPLRVDLGHTVYSVDDFRLRLGGYESSPVESFGFFTVYDQGQRTSIYISYEKSLIRMEMKCAKSRLFSDREGSQVLVLKFQLSIVM